MAKKQKHDHGKKFIITILAALLAVAIIGLLMSYAPKKPVTGNVLQDLVFAKCIDTDEGYNPYVKGIVEDLRGRGEDYCFTGDGAKVDFCIGRECFLREFACDRSNMNFKKLGAAYVDRNCPYFKSMPCYRGACVDPQNVPPEVRQTSTATAINPIYGSSVAGYEGGIEAE